MASHVLEVSSADIAVESPHEYGDVILTSISRYRRENFMNKRNRFDLLMDAVCVGYGYCGGMHGEKFVHETDLLPRSGAITADQFVELVFEAEYENPAERRSPEWLKHRWKLRGFFVDHMGSEVVDAKQLSYGDRS